MPDGTCWWTYALVGPVNNLAEDLTQEFFALFLEKDFLATVDRSSL